MTAYSVFLGELFRSEHDKRRAEHRQRAEDRQTEERANAQWEQVIQMTTKKTKFGPVKRPPSLDDDRKQADQWGEQLNEAIDIARQVAAREKALNDASAVDTKRFPSAERP